MKFNTKIVFELLSHNDLKKFKKFIYKHWDKNHIFVKNSLIFDWQHKGEKKYHYMISKYNNEIIGVHGVIPLNKFDNNLKKNEIFIALWRVLENKGIAIGYRMFKELLNIYKPKFIAGLPINQNVVPFYNKFGFSCNTMCHFVIFSPNISEFSIAKVPANHVFNYRKKNISVTYERMTEQSLLGLSIDPLFSFQKPTKSICYLINRYLKHPFYNYELYATIEKSEVKSLTVLRLIIKDNSAILTIVDFIGPNKAFPLINNLMFNLMNKYKAELVDIYSFGIPEEILYKSGFFNVKDVEGLIVPGLFEPFERNNVEITCGYFCSSKSKTPVRLFKGDSDADRPSVIQGNN